MDADEHHAAVDGWIDRWREDPPRIGFHLDRVHEKLTRHKTRLLGEGVTSPPETSKRVLVPLCGKSVDMTYLASCGHRVYGIEISTEAIEAFFDDAGLPRSVDDADAHARPRARAGAGSGLGSRDDDDGFGFGFDEDWRGAKNVKRVHSSGNIAIAEGDLFGLGVWTGRRDGSEGPRAARRGGRGEGRRHFFLNDDDDDDDDGLDDAFDDDDDADADARVGARGSISFREEALRFAAGGGPRMDAVYDRGALVAVEPSLRERYAAVVAQRMAPGAKMLLIGVAYDASSQHSNGSSPDVTAGAAEEGEHRKTSDNEPFFLGGPPYSLTAAEVRALYEPRGVDVVEILASEERVESAPPRLRERGVTSMIETTYLLRKRRHAEEKRKRRRRGGRGLIGG